MYHSPSLDAMMISAQKSCQHLIPPPTHFLDFLLAAMMQQPPFQLSHWSPGHMAHYNSLLPNYHSRSSQPCMFHDDKITRYIDKTLLNFVEIYLFTHY